MLRTIAPEQLENLRVGTQGPGYQWLDLDSDVTSATLDYRYPYNVHGSMTSLPHLPTMDCDYTEHLRHISRAPASQGTDPDGPPNSSLEAWDRYDAAKQRTRKRVEKQGELVEERFYLGGLEWHRRTLNGALVEEIETLHLFDGQQRLIKLLRQIAPHWVNITSTATP